VVFAPAAPSSITLQAQPISQTAGLSSVLTATVYDRFSNPVANDTLVTFTHDLTGTILSPLKTNKGTATSRVTITLASVAHVTATSGAAWTTTAITIGPGAPATTTVRLSLDTLMVNSHATATITATVVDAYHNPVPGVNVTGNISPATLGSLTWQNPTDANGQVVGTWTAGTAVGHGTLTVGKTSLPLTLTPRRIFLPLVMKHFPPVPVGKTLQINQGLGYSYQVTVTLNVSATVPADYIEWMRFSNDNIHWGDWITFAPTTTWQIAPHNGLATVYAQFRGHEGASSAAISNNILLFKNGDFSQPNLAYWSPEPGNKLAVSTAGEPATPGNPSGLLGSPAYACNAVPVGYGSLSQSFIMPRVPTGQRLVLDISYHIFTFDRNFGLIDNLDRFDVLFNGNPVLSDMNQNRSNDPRCTAPYDLGRKSLSIPVTGQPDENINVTFRVANLPDAAYNTYVYVDDVHLHFE
jgi:hypothetical protein